MKPSALIHLLTHAFTHGLQVLMVSSPGIGKSALVTLACKAIGAELVIMHPAVSDPTDFKGMPAVVKEGKVSLAEFLPFGNLRKLVNATHRTICFLDDIGQAPHAVQAALMQLIHAREIDGQKISDHVVFVGATNDSSHMAGVSSVLEPVKSRWHSIVPLVSDLEDWVSWALGAKVPPQVIAFIRFRPQLLNDFKPTRELKNTPSPRTVEAVGKWVAAGIEDHLVIEGAAGSGFATEFAAFLQVWRSIPDLDAIINDPANHPLPDPGNPSLAVALVCALAHRASTTNFGHIITFLNRLKDKEYAVLAIRDAISRDKDLSSLKPYTEWVVRNHQLFA